MNDTLTLAALKEQLDRLCGLVEAMRETSEVRFSRRDEAAERLHRRVDRLEGEWTAAPDVQRWSSRVRSRRAVSTRPARSRVRT